VSTAEAMAVKQRAVEDRIANLDWEAIRASLDDRGYATTGPLLTKSEVRTLRESYDDDALFRSRIVMRRHGYGEGEYKYFRYPLPGLIGEAREAIYPNLAPLANEWHKQLKLPTTFPKILNAYLKTCHAAGQRRPTPLLLKYGHGDFNRLHQDLYGPLTFPIQATILLSEPGHDFDGGEFALVEQKPRSQSRIEVVPLKCGEAVLFAVNWRPAQGTRGVYRLTMRHGVSRIRSGVRFALGIIFHDAA
jgi:uncharacterized protein